MIVNKISAQVLESFFLLVIFVWETSCTVVVNTSQTQRRDQWTKNSSCCSWCVSDSHLLVLEWGARSRNFQIPGCPEFKLRWMSWSSPRRCWWSQRAIARTAKRPSRFPTNTQRTHNISNQVLAKFKIDPEKFEIIEIDNRKDMDAIQAYMKKVIILTFWRKQISHFSADGRVVSSSSFHRRALHWGRRRNCGSSQVGSLSLPLSSALSLSLSSFYCVLHWGKRRCCSQLDLILTFFFNSYIVNMCSGTESWRRCWRRPAPCLSSHHIHFTRTLLCQQVYFYSTCISIQS